MQRLLVLLSPTHPLATFSTDGVVMNSPLKTLPSSPSHSQQSDRPSVCAKPFFERSRPRALHATALAAGGTDEGTPGFRAAYDPRFYVSYLRDPQGNNIALFSSNPDKLSRDD